MTKRQSGPYLWTRITDSTGDQSPRPPNCFLSLGILTNILTESAPTLPNSYTVATPRTYLFCLLLASLGNLTQHWVEWRTQHYITLLSENMETACGLRARLPHLLGHQSPESKESSLRKSTWTFPDSHSTQDRGYVYITGRIIYNNCQDGEEARALHGCHPGNRGKMPVSPGFP